MVANFENFEKFIVKQIVSTVEYHPETDQYDINRIHISDDIIQTIEAEGVRYGLKREQIVQIISRVSENIRTSPAVQLRYDNIEVKKLKTGQHFRVNILHPDKGAHFIEVLVTNTYHFFVLDSDIMGVGYGDELHALDNIWNNGFFIDFAITRRNGEASNRNIKLRIGKIQNVELFGPSVVHEILDSELSFTYDEKTNEDKNVKQAKEKNKNREYFVWLPNKWTPITFCWREGDLQDKASAFVIIDNEESEEAKISINQALVLPQKEEMRETLVEILFDCCLWKNTFSGTENLKYIKSVKAGKVKRVKSELGYKEWELISQPQIKFIYE